MSSMRMSWENEFNNNETKPQQQQSKNQWNAEKNQYKIKYWIVPIARRYKSLNCELLQTANNQPQQRFSEI